MKIAIQGQDYTAALDEARPLTIERKLNEPSICQLWLSLPANGSLAMPSRNQYLAVTGDDGTLYFTGYIAVTPLQEYAGLAIEGPRYRIAIQAVSDELLLDQLLMPPSTGSTSETAGALMTNLVTHTGSAALSTQGLSLTAPVSNFVPDQGASWSESAGQVASQARAAYRAVNGALTVSSVPGTVHPLNETDGSLNLAALAFTASVKRALANDVTVCGEHEPVAYVTEYFLGDGITTNSIWPKNPYFPIFIKVHHHQRAFQRACKSIRNSGAIQAAADIFTGRGRIGDEWRQRHRRRNAAHLARSGGDGRNAAAGGCGRNSFAGQHGNSGRLFCGTGDAGRLHRGLSGDGADRHRSGYLAADNSGNPGGNGVSQSIRPINIRSACGCIALRMSGRWLSIAPLETAGQLPVAGSRF